MCADTGQRQPAGWAVWARELPAAAAVPVQHSQQVLLNSFYVTCQDLWQDGVMPQKALNPCRFPCKALIATGIVLGLGKLQRNVQWQHVCCVLRLFGTSVCSA